MPQPAGSAPQPPATPARRPPPLPDHGLSPRRLLPRPVFDSGQPQVVGPRPPDPAPLVTPPGDQRSTFVTLPCHFRDGTGFPHLEVAPRGRVRLGALTLLG